MSKNIWLLGFCLLFLEVFYSNAQSQNTKNIVNVINKELDTNRLRNLLFHLGTMDSSLGSIITYIPTINVGYVCLLDNLNDGLKIALDGGEIFKMVDFFADKCKADSRLNSVLNILQNKQNQERLKDVASTLFDKFSPEVNDIGADIINVLLSEERLTAPVVNGIVRRIRNINEESRSSLATQVKPFRQIFYKDGAFYKPFNNLITRANLIFGVRKPTEKQRKVCNNLLKKLCRFLHRTIPAYLNYVFGWIKSYDIPIRIKTNLTVQASYTATSSILSPAAKVLISDKSIQKKVDEIAEECIEI